MSDETNIHARTRGAGQIAFVGAALVATCLLLLAIRGQTVWADDAKHLAAQPRFWPAVGLTTMLVGFAAHFWLMRYRRPRPEDRTELRRWVEPLEYVGWFIGFVFLVPIVGFLPMSILFAVGLTWRAGYRDRFYFWAAAVFAVVTVFFFKGFLSVNIPGGALYEIFPGPLRSFALQYL